MNILLLGSGGREHALAWKIAASPLLAKLWCAPGNAGIAKDAECVALDITDHPAVIDFCKSNKVDFVVVGPDAPIAAGMVDDLNAAGFKAFGPTQAAGRLESSKTFTKNLCRANHIPTAAYEHFTDAGKAKAYIRKQGAPIVIKADGLAAGKGVVVAMTEAEAIAAVDMMFGGGFGGAGAEVVIEEFMEGEEASFFALCDGEHALPLATAQDHKRAFDGDRGPNTGGMGAYSPAPVMTEAMCARVMEEMIYPTLRALTKMGSPYKGVLFAGVMVTKDGPKLVEYNARFGDPETQAILARLDSDLLEALEASVEGRLGDTELRWRPGASACVIAASSGYPGSYLTGHRIDGLEEAARIPGVEIFHSGTGLVDGHYVTEGGRVLGVTAAAATLEQSLSKVYEALGRIQFEGMYYRRDIGRRSLKMA